MAKAFDYIFQYCAMGSPPFVVVLTRGSQDMHYSRERKIKRELGSDSKNGELL